MGSERDRDRNKEVTWKSQVNCATAGSKQASKQACIGVLFTIKNSAWSACWCSIKCLFSDTFGKGIYALVRICAALISSLSLSLSLPLSPLAGWLALKTNHSCVIRKLEGGSSTCNQCKKIFITSLSTKN